MKTQGQIEAAICEGMSRFEQEYMGRGPKDIRTYLIDDLLVIRLVEVLTAAEKQLVKSLTAEKGRDLLKQVRVEWHCRLFSGFLAGRLIGSVRGLSRRTHAHATIPRAFGVDFGVHASVIT